MCVISPLDLEVGFKTALVDPLDDTCDNEFRFSGGNVARGIVEVGKGFNHRGALDLLEETFFGGSARWCH